MNGPTPPQAVESGRLYGLVTRYWPRIAVVLVFAVGAFEWLVGGFTADSALEVYAFAWGATTAGLWFLFEKAEKALSDQAREKVVGWLVETDLERKIASIPDQFAVLFDRVFGERHLSWRCFFRSAVASLLVVGTLFGLFIAGFPEPLTFLADQGAYPILQFLLFAAIINVVPDYISLFETRFLLRFMAGRSRVMPVLVLDIFATALISFAAVVIGMNYLVPLPAADSLQFGLLSVSPAAYGFDWASFRDLLTLSGSLGRSEITMTMIGAGAAGAEIPFGFYFYSAFFTSVWLWIYALAALLSRGLVHLGSGAGFLLRITDVEEQPFRSMGFTAVVLVSAGFLVGLPFVLLG